MPSAILKDPSPLTEHIDPAVVGKYRAYHFPCRTRAGQSNLRRRLEAAGAEHQQGRNPPWGQNPGRGEARRVEATSYDTAQASFEAAGAARPWGKVMPDLSSRFNTATGVTVDAAQKTNYNQIGQPVRGRCRCEGRRAKNVLSGGAKAWDTEGCIADRQLRLSKAIGQRSGDRAVFCVARRQASGRFSKVGIHPRAAPKRGPKRGYHRQRRTGRGDAGPRWGVSSNFVMRHSSAAGRDSAGSLIGTVKR